MKHLVFFFITCLALVGCSDQENQDNSQSEEHTESILDSNDTIEDRGTALNQSKQLVLTENSIAGIQIPFQREEMIHKISSGFDDYQVIKEMGQQDGPDFPVYNVNDHEETVLFFAMDWEDTLKLDAIYIESPVVIDEYGLKTGSSVSEIIQLRNGELKTQSDYHGHTYAYIEDSHILYEIMGDMSLPDTVDVETVKFTEDQIKNWTIINLIWR